MLWKRIICLTFVIINLIHNGNCLIPLAVPVLVGAGSGIYYFGKDSLLNYMNECRESDIPADFAKLRQLLDHHVYGQHLAKSIVVDALRSHWNNPLSPKPLTLSFHGWPGSGKNYITKFIMQSLYKEGEKSNNVEVFSGRLHFPLEENVDIYKKELYSKIRAKVKICPYQLIIFDEVDKMPHGLLDGIKPLFDYHASVDKIDFRKTVFIFLSNTGGSLITKRMLELWREGQERESITLNDFESLISQGAFNEEGGFHHSDTIRSNLIDHYIPFLPMERRHVQDCIKDEFLKRNVYDKSLYEEVLDTVAWGPEPENLFSKTGCKRLSQKVALVAQQHQT